MARKGQRGGGKGGRKEVYTMKSERFRIQVETLERETERFKSAYLFKNLEIEDKEGKERKMVK